MEEASQEAWRTIVRFLAERQEMMKDERRRGLQPLAEIDFRAGRAGQQIQRQIDARTLARDVVLQIRVERLVADLDLGCERNEQQVGIRLREAKRGDEARERQRDASATRRR